MYISDGEQKRDYKQSQSLDLQISVYFNIILVQQDMCKIMKFI